MRKSRLILLVLAIALMFLLTSCTWHFTISGILPPTVESILVVNSGAYWAQGLIYVNGENTGEYLEPFGSKTIYNVSCYENVSICLVGPYGYSHTKWIYTEPGVNYFYFGRRRIFP